LVRWAFRSILIYTFFAMTPIHPKTSNQVAAADCSEPSTLPSKEHFRRLRATADLGRSAENP
jgi:hypothetical protein